MDNDIATFLAFTGTDDADAARRFLEISGNNVEYAVQLFMESGNNPPKSNQDEEYAQRLQQEAYQENVRDADANVHRHETLLDSFPAYGQTSIPREVDMFGAGRVGIFNQRFDNDEYAEDFVDEEDDDYEDRPQIEDLDEDSDGVIQVDSDEEPARETRRVRLERNRMSELTSTQRRLAELFKPPFDLIDRINLDAAKMKGRSEKKWILLNIQNQAEFRCQMLNRDFWANSEVKAKVKKSFIFLQYQHDSVNGEGYLNFYHADEFPHIAILDPMTGERVFKWKDGEVPDVEEWLADVDLFLEKFSLQPSASNPHVNHEVKFDPDAMTEEQQIEFALKQSVAASGTNVEDAINIDEDDEVDAATDNLANETVQETADPFDTIEAQDHTEPASGSVTRIQFRFPSGKRIIHKFDFESDTVKQIYQWIKFLLKDTEESTYGIGAGDRFTMSSVGKGKLLELVDLTIGEAGLKNASVLLEKE